MSISTTENDVFTYLSANWTLTELAFPNVAFTPNFSECYITVNIAQSASSQPCKGIDGKTYQRGSGEIVGYVDFPVNTALYNGKTVLQIVEIFSNLLGQKRIGSTYLNMQRVQTVGLIDNSKFFRYIVFVPFTTDTTK